jgi:thiamine kinase-like enzyme
MEYLGEGFSNWKRLLLAGCSVSAHARRAAQILGEIHRRTAGDPEIERRFDTVRNFRQLRIEPYLLTTGERNPALRDLFSQEARRLASAREGLVHGDFSPKNFLICGERMVVLDCEVAWYGDPSFDVAFLLNHLFLKSLYHAPRSVGIEQMIPAFWKSYLDCLQTKPQNDLEERAARLLLMLMLARVDGKSPVEYLGAAQTRFVREFVRRHLTAGGFDFAALTSAWFEQIMTLPRIAQRV